MVERLQAGYPVPLRCVHEPRAGKSFALNAGMREARGAFWAFTDDDIDVSPRWLAAFWRCFIDTKADAITGKIVPKWISARPAWLTDEALRHLGSVGCLDYGTQRLRRYERPSHNLRWVGGNLAIRKEAAQRVGGYDPLMVRAQDTEYYRRCVRHGLELVYEPQALAYHKLGGDRMTPDYFKRWRHRTGYYHMYLIPWRKYHVVTLLPMWWYRETFYFFTGWIRKTLTRRPWPERFGDELRLREAWSLWLHRVQQWPQWLLTVLSGQTRCGS